MMTHQAARDLTLMAVLDISAAQIRDWVGGLTEEQLAEHNHEPVGVTTVAMFEALLEQGKWSAPSVEWSEARGDYLQALAGASDQTLRELVTLITGTDPLAETELEA